MQNSAPLDMKPVRLNRDHSITVAGPTIGNRQLENTILAAANSRTHAQEQTRMKQQRTDTEVQQEPQICESSSKSIRFVVSQADMLLQDAANVRKARAVSKLNVL